MENPILAFRKSKGWSRAEFQKQTGISYQTLRNLEIGETKVISPATLEYLSYAGINGDIQQQLNEWREKQQENRRNKRSNIKYNPCQLKLPLQEYNNS